MRTESESGDGHMAGRFRNRVLFVYHFEDLYWSYDNQIMLVSKFKVIMTKVSFENVRFETKRKKSNTASFVGFCPRRN